MFRDQKQENFGANKLSMCVGVSLRYRACLILDK